jgi:hypothetical protein
MLLSASSYRTRPRQIMRLRCWLFAAFERFDYGRAGFGACVEEVLLD